MGYMMRSVGQDAKLSDVAALEALAVAVPHSVVESVIADQNAAGQRNRKLPGVLTALLVVAMGLFTDMGLEKVLMKLLAGARLVGPDPDIQLGTREAISQARYRLGARPIVELFHRVCHPMATLTTKGAFLFGLRLMAIDLTCEDVPDTPENLKAFGKHWSDRGESAFPQVLTAYLDECGTHAIVDAGFWPCHSDPHAAGQRMLRSVTAGMLVMWDCGLHSFDMVAKTLARGAQLLGRVPSYVNFKPILTLPDGTHLAYIYPSDRRRRNRGEHALVRVIEYTLTDPNRPGYLERHRLITSLLDPELYPALELVCAYHERWEIEITIDEIDTHQRLPLKPVRSKKPVGVIQEFYGLLIAHYAIRRVMHDSAVALDIDPDRISFTNAVEIIATAIYEFQLVSPAQGPALYRRMLRDIGRHQLPERANRINPRVVKRKMSKFPLKRPHHRNWPQPTKTFREAIALIA